MSYPNRPLASHLRHPSTAGGGSQGSSGQSPALVARINEKKAELDNLKQLRDLSAGLAGQMQMLEDKLATLADGTEAVAAVLSNWHNVLRAIHLASMKLPKPEEADGQNQPDEEAKGSSEVPLPQALVRIPTQPPP
ncbi:MAG: hypothetical protein M1832_003989 [Thelocarpon impressellum]|nr:MAG: hypothetical protein M1832_003989 [Thelocarpon impressellum]